MSGTETKPGWSALLAVLLSGCVAVRYDTAVEIADLRDQANRQEAQARAVAVAAADPSTNTSASAHLIHTNFVERAVLSGEQLRTVFEPAADCGLRNPVSVGTGYLKPIQLNWAYYVWLRGEPIIVGRRKSFVEVWMYQTGSAGPPRYALKAAGDFWVEGAQARLLTSFSISNQTVYAELEDGIPISVADKLVQEFAQSRVTMAEPWPTSNNSLFLLGLKEIRRPPGQPDKFLVRFGDTEVECYFKNREVLGRVSGEIQY